MNKEYAHCEECPLKDTEEPHNGTGSYDARFFVVTDSPSCHKSSLGKLMSIPVRAYFDEAMETENFGREDFFFYPQVRCMHDPDKYSSKEKTAIRKACKNYLKEEIQTHLPELVISLGAEASKQALGRAVKITQARGTPEYVEDFKCQVYPMLSPMMAVVYPQHKPTFEADCATLGRLVDNNYDITLSGSQNAGEYSYIDDLQFLIDAKPEIISFDTENTGLDWFAPDADILTMQFCIKEGEAYVLPWNHPDRPQSGRAKKRLMGQLRELLCNPDIQVIGQNPKYDAVYTKAVLGLDIYISQDTLMLATLIDENAQTKNLDDLIKRYVPAMAGYGDSFNATVDKSKMIEQPLDDKFLVYAAGDADAGLRLFNVLYPMVAEDSKLLASYEWITIPALNAFKNIELRGWYVDEEEVEKFEQYMEEKLAEDYENLIAQVPRSIKRLHIDKGSGGRGTGLSFTRAEFVRDILFLHKEGFRLKPKVFTKTTSKLDKARQVPSISTKDHLPYFYDDCPFVLELAEYIKAERILSTNLKGFKKKYIHGGMVRPIYNLFKAVTGRSSSEKPNGQNVPKRGKTAKAYRKIFVAPEGKIMLQADLSQAELRIAADMANDKVLIDIYSKKGDVHVSTALIVMGLSLTAFKALSKEERELGRFKSKAVNFGFIYGMWWRKFVGYAKTQYGVEFTDNEAKAIREAFFAKYYGLAPWHEKMKALAHKNGYVRSYSGRIRHLPMIYSDNELVVQEAERQAVNAPVQEFASSLGLMAMGRIDAEVNSDYLELIGFVHDALYAYAPLEYAEWGAKTMKYYMETNPIEEAFGLRMKVPIVADVSLGYNMSEMEELAGMEVDFEGYQEVGTYDFSELWDAEKNSGIILPRQLIPYNDGFIN